MNKIAMGRSIGDAYDLAFGRYFAVLGVVWLPILLIAAGQAYFLVRFGAIFADYFRFVAAHPKGNTIPPGQFAMDSIIWTMNGVVYVMAAWMRVGVTKAALGLPRGPAFAYFFVGLDELRVIGGYIVYLAMYLAVTIGVVVAVIVVAAVVAALAAGGAFALINQGVLAIAGVSLVVAAALGIGFAVIYFQVRLFYLFVPITVAEKRFGLMRSWEMSEGNFWRIIVIAIGTFSPLVLLEMALLVAVYVPLVVSVIATAQHHPELAHHPELVAPVLLGTMMKDALYFGPVLGLVGLILAPIFCGLSFAPAAYAYRSLTQKPSA